MIAVAIGALLGAVCQMIRYSLSMRTIRKRYQSRIESLEFQLQEEQDNSRQYADEVAALREQLRTEWRIELEAECGKR